MYCKFSNIGDFCFHSDCPGWFYKPTRIFSPKNPYISHYQSLFPRCGSQCVGQHLYAPPYLDNYSFLDHLRNNLQNQFHCSCLCNPENVSYPNSKRFSAIHNASQKYVLVAILEAMRNQKLDPKHVRDFFYRHALSVRLMNLFFDGVWWVISRSVLGLTMRPWRWLTSLFPFWLQIDEFLRKFHLFVIGKTGVGKTVLLHHLIRRDLIWNQKPSIVLLDPHGDLARFVAQDKSHLRGDRLVYIHFSGLNGRFAHFNPFDLSNPTEFKLNRAQLQFSGAVEQIIGEPFTPRQRTLIRACVGILLHMPGATLLDLVRLLQDGQNADLVQYGQQSLPNVVDRQFFTASFHESGYRATKHALACRLIDVIRDPVVRSFTCHKSSIDLGQILDSGKVLVVCFDPSQQGRETIRTIGQLLNAAILSHVLGRPVNRRHPIHLFIDECQYFISSTIADILGECRKFGLYLTLATQRTERLDPKLQDAILGNVGNIWVGGSGHITAEKIGRETNISPEKIRSLPPLRFFEVAIGKPVKFHKLRYLGSRYCMNPNQWKKLLKSQSERYYRNPSATRNAIVPKSSPTWEPKFP